MTPFDDNTINANSWCSVKDCKNFCYDIQEHLNGEKELLESTIVSATASAKAKLRKRYGNTMPFSESSPPYDVRYHIAVCASYLAIRSRAYSVGSHEGLLESIKEDCEKSKKYFEDIAEGIIDFERISTENVKPAITPNIKGNFGFDGR